MSSCSSWKGKAAITKTWAGKLASAENMGWQAGGVSNTSPTVLCEAPVLAGASCFCETLYSEGSEKFFPFPIDEHWVPLC